MSHEAPAVLPTPPTRAAALQRLAQVHPAAYARSRNHLDGAVTGLSPYLTHGLLTLPEVLEAVLRREPLEVQHKLVFEFGWREYFRHVWRHLGDGILSSLHEGPQPEQAYASRLPDDVRHGCTGIPVVDQAVHTLYATGTLHNHARMWLASYVVHVRHVHWRAGADWMVAHLLDGDLASNHLSWQWVAGTGSHKPYLFNADNVARYAPAAWHSPGTVIDQPYDALDAMARGGLARAPAAPRAARQAPLFDPQAPDAAHPAREPTLLCSPPADLALTPADAQVAPSLRGRTVWLMPPWALRAPPPDLPHSTVVIGVYLREHHEAWPWPETRWRWVDAAMAAHTGQRWWVDAAGLQAALSQAAEVRSVEDPHLAAWLPGLARCDRAPRLFPEVEPQCRSFSQWWTRATRGLRQAGELLRDPGTG